MISESKLSKKEPNNNTIFENRAWEKAEHPRLEMKEPETFIHTKIENFNPKGTEIHLSIDYHYGRNSWCLNIERNDIGINNCTGEMKFFSSVKKIVEYIKKTYKKNPILPKKWR